MLTRLALCLLPTFAWANCAPTEVVELRLGSQFAESIVGIGTCTDRMGRVTVVRLWVSKSGSFTVTETSPEGITCAIMSGHDFWIQAPEPVRRGKKG